MQILVESHTMRLATGGGLSIKSDIVCIATGAGWCQGHCLIVPAEHVASTRQVDEHVWTEIRNFKKCLLQMFMAQVLHIPRHSPTLLVT